MFYRAITVSSFFLIAWLTLENTKLKTLNVESRNNMVKLEHKLANVETALLKNQTLIEQQLAQQDDMMALEQKALDEMRSKLKALPKQLQRKPVQAKRVQPKPKKQPANKTLSAKEIINSFNAKLVVIDKYQKSKKTDKSRELLTNFKKDVWDLRKHQSLGKDKTLSILSSIDNTLEMWKKGDLSKTTESIKTKIRKIVSVKGASK